MATKPTAFYIVIYSGTNWWVDFEGEALGPFPDKETAAREAVRAAKAPAPGARPFEIWIAQPEGLQRLGPSTMRERYAAQMLPPAPRLVSMTSSA